MQLRPWLMFIYFSVFHHDLTVLAAGTEPPADFSDGCKTQWNTLLAKDQSRKADGAYMLAVAKQAGRIGNKHSFWVHLNCEGDKLVHDHCRFGDRTERGFLFILISKYFLTYGDAVADDNLHYVCKESKDGEITAKVVGDYAGFATMTEECRRMPGSDWCGVPASVAGLACQSEWNILQKNRWVDEEGWMRLKSRKPEERNVWLQLACVGSKLSVGQCSPNKLEQSFSTYEMERGEELNSGTYLKHGDLVFTCPPHKKGGYSAAELEKAIIVLPWKEGKLPKELNGFKPSLPAGIDQCCAGDWLTLTANGDREVDAKGYVNIVKSTYVFASYAGYKAGSIWVFFKCTPPVAGDGKQAKGHLTLEHCRVSDNLLLPPASSFYKEYHPIGGGQRAETYYHNCGSKDETTPAAVEDKVTRTTKAVKGLQVLNSLSTI